MIALSLEVMQSEIGIAAWWMMQKNARAGWYSICGG